MRWACCREAVDQQPFNDLMDGEWNLGSVEVQAVDVGQVVSLVVPLVTSMFEVGVNREKWKRE